MKKYGMEIKATIVVLMIAFALFSLAQYLYNTKPKLQTYDEVVAKFVTASPDQNYRQYIQLVTHCK